MALDRDTRSIMQQKSLNYSDAFREAQELAPATASIYNQGIKLAQYTDSTTEPSPVILIANLAGSIREFPGGPIDFARAADAVNQFVAEDIRISAASECLDRLARHWSKDRADRVQHLDLAEAASDDHRGAIASRSFVATGFSRIVRPLNFPPAVPVHPPLPPRFAHLSDEPVRAVSMVLPPPSGMSGDRFYFRSRRSPIRRKFPRRSRG